jgi:phosphoribosylformimino-5-aminoimidazole carboxamide ribotide isomerase
MIVYPAIDLRDGKCVRLTKGDFATTKVYNDNPASILSEFAKFGATWVHMVDLDGAKAGTITQGDLIKSLVSSSDLKIQVGGGIRNSEDIERLFEYGVSRVVLGSICVSNKELVKQWLDKFGCEKIVLALDCHLNSDGTPMVKTHGWRNESTETVWDLLNFYATAKYVLCTDISVDGTLEGPSINLYQELQQRFPEISLIASGGVGTFDDLIKLKELNVYGVVVGKAIYEGKIPLDKIEFA